MRITVSNPKLAYIAVGPSPPIIPIDEDELSGLIIRYDINPIHKETTADINVCFTIFQLLNILLKSPFTLILIFSTFRV